MSVDVEKEETCPNCKGEGKIKEGESRAKACDWCRGRGKMKVVPPILDKAPRSVTVFSEGMKEPEKPV